ncbi:ATP synthase F1 subunit gamma [Candidatus Gracilibacteria bacterium]|nr:ATP synthase F1 subunit gamma [Candidatus Gracilibacteria bacterium]
MPNSGKETKRKIKSIKSTRQITKAMELVATSKMKKATDNAINLRSYGYLAINILSKLSKKHADMHPFLKEREVKNALVLFFTTDKGLCGGLNANLFKKAVHTIKGLEEGYPNANIHYITSGKKGADFLHRMGKQIDMAFPSFTARPSFNDAMMISRLAVKGFEKGEYDKIIMIYPDFLSVIQQKPVSRTLLPFSVDVFKEMVNEIGSKFSKVVEAQEKDIEYKLEPSPQFILDNIVPQMINMQIFQAILETTASEFAARMVAMQNATGAADDLLENLILTYNRARQSAITAEISEITSSCAAIS